MTHIDGDAITNIRKIVGEADLESGRWVLYILNLSYLMCTILYCNFCWFFLFFIKLFSSILFHIPIYITGSKLEWCEQHQLQVGMQKAKYILWPKDNQKGIKSVVPWAIHWQFDFVISEQTWIKTLGKTCSQSVHVLLIDRLYEVT